MPNIKKCQVCGKRLQGLEGIHLERREADKWTGVEVPLCEAHRAQAWERVKAALLNE